MHANILHFDGAQHQSVSQVLPKFTAVPVKIVLDLKALLDEWRVITQRKTGSFLYKYKHPRGEMTITRPLCLVESYTLDAAVRRERSLFTSFTFCNVMISCSLRPKENIRCVHLPVFY